jgi:DNA (cytosine-5)-methyltransferase 1
MDSLPPRFGEAYERVKNAGGRKNRLSSGNLREQVVHLLPVPDSSLLRTPAASEGERGHQPASKAKARGGQQTLSGQFMDLFPTPNLPTPTVSDQYTGNLASTQQKPGSMHSVTLAQVFHKPELFPTPTTQDGKNNGGPSQFNRNTKPLNTEVLLIGTPRASNYNSSSKQVDLGAPKSRIEDQVLLTNWGKFEPAIKRWEAILGRPAPEPTKPDGKDNNHRLSSKFTEWMMGLPDGWITGHNLKRNDELKLAGNGVVPQQAELALRLLLDLPEIREN